MRSPTASAAAAVLFFLLLYDSNLRCRGIRVLTSQISLEEEGTAVSGVRLVDDRNVSISDVSLCMRFNYKLLGGWEQRSQLMHIEDWRTQPGESDIYFFALGANYPKSFLNFGYPKKNGSYASSLINDPRTGEYDVWGTNRWSHVCFSYRKKDGFTLLVKDGEPLNINFPPLPDVNIPPNFLSKIYLARCSFNYTAACSAPEGKITDFNVWDKALSLQEAKDWTTCRKLTKGNLVNWENALFNMEKMSEDDLPMDEVCVHPKLGHVIMPVKMNFSSHLSLCQKFRGRMGVVKDAKTQTSMTKEILKRPQCSDILGSEVTENRARYWIGWTDYETEGVFLNANNGEVMSRSLYKHFVVGEPNGFDAENCLMAFVYKDTWNDQDCNREYCSFCELDKAPDIHIRGLCAKTVFDTKYSWTNQFIDDRHSFRGYTGTSLRYSATSKTWILENKRFNVTANTSSVEFPFGNHQWLVSNDSCGEDGKPVTLNINVCNREEFNCDDGYCINLENRCDGTVQCPDKSDEVDCETIIAEKSYLQAVPPSSHNSPTVIKVDIETLQILGISEVDNTISIQLNLALVWSDHRLIMQNLNNRTFLNTLTNKQYDKIWVPKVIFRNTYNSLESLIDDRALMTITRLGDFKLTSQFSLQNAYIFKGSENPITISRVYFSEFLCDFDMAMYPFDTQQCFINLIPGGNTGEFIELVPGFLNYTGPLELTQYFIKDYKIENITFSSNRAVSVSISFGRRILATILTTYLPTLLLCLVCFSTNHFQPSFFEAIVAVNLTSLLVLTTLFISVYNSLPDTAYIKMIDVWLIFILLVPFFEVILHTIMDYARSNIAKDTRIHPMTLDHNLHAKHQHTDCNLLLLRLASRAASVGLPVTVAAFAVIYFVVGFTHYHSYDCKK